MEFVKFIFYKFVFFTISVNTERITMAYFITNEIPLVIAVSLSLPNQDDEHITLMRECTRLTPTSF